MSDRILRALRQFEEPLKHDAANEIERLTAETQRANELILDVVAGAVETASGGYHLHKNVVKRCIEWRKTNTSDNLTDHKGRPMTYWGGKESVSDNPKRERVACALCHKGAWEGGKIEHHPYCVNYDAEAAARDAEKLFEEFNKNPEAPDPEPPIRKGGPHDNLSRVVRKDSSTSAVDSQPLYYIQDKRQYVGNSMLWWRPGGAGYTTDISQAGQFDHKPTDREDDVLWPVEYIDSIANLHVDQQRVDPSVATIHGDDDGS